jgi:hypothetical protein
LCAGVVQFFRSFHAAAQADLDRPSRIEQAFDSLPEGRAMPVRHAQIVRGRVTVGVEVDHADGLVACGDGAEDRKEIEWSPPDAHGHDIGANQARHAFRDGRAGGIQVERVDPYVPRNPRPCISRTGSP